MRFPGALLLLVVLAACAPPPEGTPADRAAIAALYQAQDDATVTGDAPRLLDLLTDDVVLQPAGLPAIEGRPKVTSWLRWYYALFTVTARTSTLDEILVTGDWAYTRGSYELQYEPDDEDPVTETGQFAGLLRRDKDGSWKITRHMWNVTTSSAGAP